MKLLFEYYLHEDYEGHDGYMRPTISLMESGLSEYDEKIQIEQGDFDFMFFIPNLDTLQKITDAKRILTSFLNNQHSSSIFIFDNYCRKAKIDKYHVEINLNIFQHENNYRGQLPTNLFLNILNEWEDFLKSKNISSKTVDFEWI